MHKRRARSFSFLFLLLLFFCLSSSFLSAQRIALLWESNNLENLTEVQKKLKKIVSSRLFGLFLAIERDPEIIDLPGFQQKFSADILQIDDLNRIRVEIGVPRIDYEYSDRLKNIGFEVVHEIKTFRRYDGWLPIKAINELAKLDFISFVRAIGKPIHNIVTTEGDIFHRALDVRNSYGFTGSGIKIGIIAEGVWHLNDVIAAGELPSSIQVLNAGIENAEGTAMLEIVHDLAPEAELYFASSGTSEADIVNSIDILEQAGCVIICDDIVNTHEPSFMDGQIALRITQFANNGGIYISAAGNERENHYIGDYVNAGDNWNRFELSGGYSNFVLIPTVWPGDHLRVFLQWNDEYGSSGNNYDLYLFDENFEEVASCTDPQDGNQDPYEELEYIYNNSNPLEFRDFYIAIKNKDGAAASRKLNLWLYSRTGNRIEIPARVFQSSTWGHCTALDCISVAAIINSSIQRSYSSEGPAIIYSFDSQGNPVSSTLRMKPDLSALDGVHTFSSMSGYKPFHPNSTFPGTSAAAPHIAGIAALIWSGSPTKTGAEIIDILKSSAVALPEGSAKNNQYGEGRADALNAIENVVSKIIASTSTLPDFGSVQIGSNSPAQSYSVSGSNLSDNITISAPSSFQISKDGNIFSGSLVLNHSGGTVPSTTIYARFSPACAGGQSGNITHISSGSLPEYVHVSGTGTEIPIPRSYILSVTANPNPVQEDFPTQITATLTDQNMVPVSGKTITFTSDYPPGLTTADTTDMNGQVKKYFSPEIPGTAIITIESETGDLKTLFLSVSAIPGDASAGIYVRSAVAGSVYDVEANVTKGASPAAHKSITMTTSHGQFYYNGSPTGSQTFTDLTDYNGEFPGAENDLEIHISGYTGYIVVTLLYEDESYETATTFLCSSSSFGDMLPLYVITTLNTAYRVDSVSWSHDGAQLYAGTYAGSNPAYLYGWNTSDWSQKFIQTNLDNDVMSSAVKADNSRIVLGENGGEIEIFDSNGTYITGWDHCNDVPGVDWVGNYIYAFIEAGSSTTLTNHGCYRYNQTGGYTAINTFNPDTSVPPKTNLVYSSTKNIFAYAMEYDIGGIGTSVLFIHNGTNPFSYQQKTLYEPAAYHLDISQSGNKIAVVGNVRGATIVDANNPDNTFSITESESNIYDLCEYLGSSDNLACGGNGLIKLRVFDPTGRIVFEPGLTQDVYSMDYCESNKMLAVGLGDGSILVYGYDLASPEIANSSVSPDTYSVGTIFTISCELTDTLSGVNDSTAIAVIRDASNNIIAQVALVHGAGNSYSCQWDSSGVANGTYTIGVYAEDNAGNYSENRNIRTIVFTSTCTISGYVYLISGGNVSGVVMSGLPDSPITDETGYYSSIVPFGWSGEIIPIKAGYIFSPSGRSFISVTTSQNDQNFDAAEINYTISGIVTDGVSPIPSASLSGFPNTTQTDSYGVYAAVVPPGWTGTVTPQKTAYVFSPTSIPYVNVTSNQSNQDYVGTIITYTISGHVQTSGGAPIPGVVMSGLPGNPVTDGSGNYSGAVSFGWSGTVTPTLAGYTFTPPLMSYTNVTSNQTGQNYVGTAGPAILIIDLDENKNSGTYIRSAIEVNGFATQYETSMPSSISVTANPAAFVCLGVYNNNHVLSDPEGLVLKNYLDAGGRLYMEGGDTWSYDQPTPAHSYFGITNVHDGAADTGLTNGIVMTFTQGINFIYAGENNFMDRIAVADGVNDAFVIWDNQNPFYHNGVARSSGNFRTIGVSFEFGGIPTSSRNSIMQGYLGFLIRTGDEVTSSIVADFGSLGLWHWNSSIWSGMTAANAQSVIACDIDGDGELEVIGDFGSIGVWLRHNGDWTMLTGVNVEAMISVDSDGDNNDELVGDFGILGVWLWDSGTWSQLSGVDVGSIIDANTDGDADYEIIGNFGSLGVWHWNSGIWTQLTGVSAKSLASADTDGNGAEEVIGDFGTLGVWIYRDSLWSQLSGATADKLISIDTDADGNKEILGDFGYLGIWLWNSGTWSEVWGSDKIYIVDAEDMARANIDIDAGDEIIIDRGTSGLWIWDSGTLYQMSTNNPESSVVEDIDKDGIDEIITDLGTQGLWIADVSSNVWSWKRITTANAENIITGNIIF